MKSVTTVATLFTITGLTTAFNSQPNYGRHSHANTASYNSLRDMAAYPETFSGPNVGGGGAFGMDGDWRTGNGYSQGGPGMGFRDMETNPYYNEGWGQESRLSRGGPSMGRRGGGGMMGGPRSADGFDPYGPYSPAMGMSRSDRRLDQGDLFMNSDSMGMRSDRTMRGFTYSGRNREYGEAYDPGMMFEMMDGPPPGMMGPGGMMDGPDMGMMGGGGDIQGGMGGRMGP